MRTLLALVIALTASGVEAASYRIQLASGSTSASLAITSPVTQLAVALPRINLGNCPGGVCPVPQSPAAVRERVSSVVKSVSVHGNRPVLRIAQGAASLVRDRQPVRSAVRRVIGIVGRLFGR